MDIDCQKVIQIIGRRCGWEKKYPVPEDEKLVLALKSAGLSEILSYLCLEELINTRYITKKNNNYKLTDKGYDYGYPKRLEQFD